MQAFNRGDFVKVNGVLGVVVGVAGEEHVPEDHLAIWFGTDRPTSSLEGNTASRPEVWTIPQEYAQLGPRPARSPIRPE